MILSFRSRAPRVCQSIYEHLRDSNLGHLFWYRAEICDAFKLNNVPGPCLVDMKRTCVVFQPAGWRWRWEKTVLQGKFCPWRKTATTYMVQCIDKSPVDDIDGGLQHSLLGLKSSKQDSRRVAWRKNIMWCADWHLARHSGPKVSHLEIP